MKEYVFISLGSACDVAIFLDNLKLRNQSFPFDWLWNHYSGLEFITSSLKDKFSHLGDSQNYELRNHYRFSDPVVTYKNFDKVVHVHSNPLLNLEDHLSFKRRFERFNNELKSTSFKRFIYYRKLTEDIMSGLTDNMEHSFGLILTEGYSFVEQLLLDFPNIHNRFQLLLLMQCEPTHLTEAKELLRVYRKKNRHKSLLSLAVAPVRHPNNRYQHLKWSYNFLNVVLKEFNLTLPFKIELYFKGSIRHIVLLKRLIVIDIRIWALKGILKTAKKLPFFE